MFVINCHKHKGIDLSPSTHSHVVPNMYGFLSLQKKDLKDIKNIGKKKN